MAKLIFVEPRGDHSTKSNVPPKVINAANALLDDMLKEFDGDFRIQYGDQIRMRGDVRVRLGNAVGNRLTVKLKPGDNTTAREWHISPPAPLTAPSLYRMLKDRQGVPNGDSEPQEAPAEPAPQVLPPITAFPAKTLLERIAELDAEAASYDKRAADIIAAEEELARQMAFIEQLQQEHDNDFTGKAARTRLAEIHRAAGL